MTTSALVVRPLRTQEEREQFCWLDVAVFSPPATPASVEQTSRFLATQPGLQLEHYRGAFLDDKLVGCYIISPRNLHMDSARLLTGCIGDVAVHPDYRKRGIASAMMLDAIQYAQQQPLALLMLDGIGDFYHRYGYTDVYDGETQEVQRASILALEAGPYTVRLAREEDAAAILALYKRHFGHYTASFERTLETQQHLLTRYLPNNRMLLAHDESGKARGYIILAREDAVFATEVAADNWEATRALIWHQAQRTEGPPTLRYHMPNHSPFTYRLIDHLEKTPDNPPPKFARDTWAIQGHTYHELRADWMGRVGHMPTLAEALLPELQTRWQRSPRSWSGTLRFEIGDDQFALRVDKQGVRFNRTPGIASETIQLTPQAFTQLIFGYRPAAYLLQESGYSAADEVSEILDVLFPNQHTWITSSDWF